MSEERKLILQMVADGKITPEEADSLLQAIDETERAAQSAATETVQQNTSGQSRQTFDELGNIIEKTVHESLRGLDETLRTLEIKLQRQLNDPSRRQLFDSVEEKVRHSVEKAVEKAAKAEERAAQAAERAARQAGERAERMSHRMERMARRAGHFHHSSPIIKMGVAIDRLSVQKQELLTLPGGPGDRFSLDGRVGDMTVTFYDGQEIQVEVRKEVWGENERDAEERATATRVRLERHGHDVVVEVDRPHIVGIGFMQTRDTRIDYVVRLPHGTDLTIDNKVGDLRVTAPGKIGVWDLRTKVGEIDLTVGAETGFEASLECALGGVGVAIPGAAPLNAPGDGRSSGWQGKIGDGSGRITAVTKTGDIRLHY